MSHAANTSGSLERSVRTARWRWAGSTVGRARSTGPHHLGAGWAFRSRIRYGTQCWL